MKKQGGGLEGFSLYLVDFGNITETLKWLYEQVKSGLSDERVFLHWRRDRCS